MSKPRPPLLSFNGGEVDSKTLGRVDLEIYPRLAEVMLNILPDERGGMFLSPGTIYLGETTPSNGVAVIRTLTFSETDRQKIEISEGQIRVFGSGNTEAGTTTTLGAWSDESAAAETGGGTPPTGGDGGNDYSGPPWWYITDVAVIDP